MFLSFKVILLNLLIFYIGMIICYKLGEEQGSDNAYYMGYKACEEDWNYSKKLRFEFEDFLAAKGYAIDKSSKLKSLKTLDKQLNNTKKGAKT